MPIKPENRHRYPANWKQIRAEILQREGHRCKFCRVDNHAVGARDTGGRFWTAEEIAAGKSDEAGAVLVGERALKIVLTIAHLDHAPENNDPANLAALCQRCHLRHDREHHAEQRISNRALRSGDIFGGAAG